MGSLEPVQSAEQYTPGSHPPPLDRGGAASPGLAGSVPPSAGCISVYTYEAYHQARGQA